MGSFPELNLNEANEKWLNLLVKNEADKTEFMNPSKNYYDKQNSMLGVLAFRKYLLEKRINKCEVTQIELGKATRRKDIIKLTEMLSNMFLEAISDREINDYIDSVITADELIQLHNYKNYKGVRFNTILKSWKPMLEIIKEKELKKAI